MTEAEWLYPDQYPDEMLIHVGPQASERKLRLFAVGCCTRVAHLLTDVRSRRSLALIEAVAEGRRDRRALERPRPAPAMPRNVTGVARYYAQAAAWNGTAPQAWEAAREVFFCSAYAAVADRTPLDPARWDRDEFADDPISWLEELLDDIGEACTPEWRWQAALVCEVFGNPFRPTAFDPAWRTPQVLALARTAYEERRWEELPLLADALEEAGCDNDAILNHCREQGPHVRGCWVIDLVLAKEGKGTAERRRGRSGK
jgi:hypothetical protein